jgi:6-phosphogluconolactonase
LKSSPTPSSPAGPAQLWTRRSFVQTLTSLGGFAALAPAASASAILGAGRGPAPRFAYVATEHDAIHVFRISASGAWKPVQVISTPSPSALTLSPNQRHLYVSNAVNTFEHRPTGSVEAFAVNPDTGHLSPLNRRPLALSATLPKHLAVSPDGRQLAVTSTGGASYNLLPLRDDGSIGHVTATLKQIGSSVHPVHQSESHPQAIHFLDDATLLAVDAGSDRISSFSISADGALSLNAHHAASPGTGPTHIAASREGRMLFIAGSLDPAMTSLRHRSGEVSPAETTQRLTLPATASGITALAVHPSGDLLFASDASGIWLTQVDRSGHLTAVGTAPHHAAGTVALAAASDGTHLIALSGQGSILRFQVDQPTASLASPSEVAHLDRPTAIALKHA